MLDTSTLNGKPAGRAGWKTVLPIQKHEFVVGWRAVLKGKSCSQNRKKKRFSISVGGFQEVTSQRKHFLEILHIFGRPWAPTHYSFGSKFC